MHEPIRQVIVPCGQESPGESYVGVKRRSHDLSSCGVDVDRRNFLVVDRDRDILEWWALESN